MFELSKYIERPFKTSPYPCGEDGKPPRYTMTEEVENTSRLMRETIDRLLRFEERIKNDIANLSSNLTSDNVMFKDVMHESWTSFLMEVKNEINTFESGVNADLDLFKSDVESNYTIKVDGLIESLQEKYDTFSDAVNSRLDNYNANHSQAFEDYRTKLQTYLNTFEQTMNANYANFTESVNNSIEAFMNNWEETIEARLDAVDGKVSDAEMYMKTNFVNTVTSLVGDMHANGELADIIEGEVFNDLEAKVDGLGHISVLYFGVTGDGVEDDTEGLCLAIAYGKPVNLCNRSIVVSDTIALSVPLVDGTIIYRGSANAPVFSMRDGGALKNVKIIIATQNYASSVILADYTQYTEANNPMKFVVENVNIDNTLCTSFIGGSSCVKIKIDKYKVITGQNIDGLRFDGHIDNGICIESVLRDENDNPVFNTAVFKNVFFASANCALKVLPTIASGSIDNAKSEVKILLVNFANQHIDGINKPFIDVRNAIINGVAVIPWDYYGEKIPACGTYACINSAVLLDFDYFPSKTHDGNVKFGWTNYSTGEAFTNQNVFEAKAIEDRAPYRGSGSTKLGWGVDNIKAVRFKPSKDNVYNNEYMGFELQKNNADDPSCDKVVQFGFNDNGSPYTRKFDADSESWEDLRRIYIEGSMPTSYSGKRPDGKAAGDMKFDTTLNKPVWWTGSEWVLADGTPI